MSAAKHTPGKWFVDPPHEEDESGREKYHWSVRYECTTGACVSAEIAEVTSLNTGHEEANACLMAAAPELLEALQLMASVFFDFSGSHGSVETIAMEKAEAAIAKATGGAA